MDTSLRSAIRPAVRDAYRTDSGLARLVLARYGTDAHVWIPGIGYFNGLQAGNYIDSAGTQAGLVDNPVGLAMDAANTALGSELVTNGGFDSATGWTAGTGWTISGGVASATGPTGDGLYTSQAAYTTGKVYLVSFDKTGTQNISVYLRASGPFTTTLSGRVFMYITAGASATRGVEFYFAGTGGTIDNISVREVTGAITATQGTTANKPILRRGAVNLLTYSEQFDNAAWTKSSVTVTANAGTSPDSTSTATTLVETSATAGHAIYGGSASVTAGLQYTMSMFVKKGTGGSAPDIVQLTHFGTPFGTSQYANFNIASGVVTAEVGGTASIVNAGSGWWRIAFTALCTTSGTAGTQLAFVNNNATATRIPSYTGSTSVNAFIWGAQLELGSTASEYIPTTTAAASSSSGNYYWQFDGSNDSLALSSVPFQTQDNHAVVVGFSRQSSSGANPRIFALTSAGSAVIHLRIDSTQNQAFYLVIDDAGTSATTSVSNAAEIPNGSTIFIASLRQVGNARIGRLNGVLKGTNSTTLSTSTLTGGTIGSSGASAYFGGSIFPVIAIKGTVSDADLLILERWVGQMSGVSI